MSHSTDRSSSTSDDEVHVEIDEQAYDPIKEMMSLVLQQHQQLMESYQRRETRRRRWFIQRNREAGNERLVNDYFSTNPVYHDEIFRRRFRMRRELLLNIVNALENHSTFFQQRDDAVRRKGFSPLQKYTVAIRQLTYGVPADNLDEYLRVGESTVIKCLFKFCEYVVEIFGDRYLRRPNADMLNVFFKCMTRAMASLACWVALIVCTGNRKIVQFLGKVNLQGEMVHQQSCLKRSRLITNWYNDEGDEPAQPIHGSNREFQDYLRTNSELRDTKVHHQLRADLVEHIWGQYNNNP